MKTNLLFFLLLPFVFCLPKSFSQDLAPVANQTLTTFDCTCTGTNLVLNPSFENGTTSWDWGGGTLSSGTGAIACGAKSGDFLPNNTQNWVSQTIGTDLTIGSKIDVKVYAGVHNNVPYSSVGIIFFDANWVQLTESAYLEVDKVLAASPVGPQLYTLTANIPSKAKYTQVGFGSWGSSNTWVKTDAWCATVTPPTVCNASISGLRFYDTASNSTIAIVNNGSYDINSLPSSFGIEALVTGTLESMTFNITGSATANNLENVVPYTYPGTGTAWPHGIGTFTVTAKAYTADNAGGSLCDTKTFKFTLTDNTCDCTNSPDNLVKNPSFQNSIFNEFWSSTNGTLASSTTYKACGDKGVVLTHTTGTASIWQKINVSNAMPVGANITFSAFAGTHAAGQNCTPKLIVEFFKADNTFAGTSLSTPITRNVDVAPVNVLAQFSVTGTIPTETAYIKVGGSITCDYIKFDAACIKINCIPVFAGTDKEVKRCDSDLSVINLNDVLTDEQPNGAWTINGQTVSNLFTPVAGSSTTLCTYTVTGTLPCGNDQSTVKIIMVPKANAGGNGTYDVCDSDLSAIDLYTKLTGTPQSGGIWSQIGTGGTLSGGMFTPVVGSATYSFMYTISGTSPCANSTATVTINVKPQNNAGGNGTYDVCDSDLSAIDLYTKLGGTPQSGGIWSQIGTGGTLSGGMFTPVAGSATYTFMYTVSGNSPCANSTATVTINVFSNNITINAGPDGEVCSRVADQGLPVKTYQLAGSMTGASSVLWSDGGAGGTFDDPSKLNAIYTPPIGVASIVLTLTSNDPQGPCLPVSDNLTLKEIACAGILDPCTCNQVTYNPNEVMEVKDFIEIDGTAGDVWKITANGGGLNPNNGLPYGTMQQLDPAGLVTTNVDFPIGTIIPAVPGNSAKFKLDFAHDSGKGYSVTVKNDKTGQELSISNYCVITTFTPNFTVGATICSNGANVNLASIITDGTPADPTGTVDYYYINNLGVEVPITTAFKPADYPAGTVVQIFGRYTPNNVIDCKIIRQATNSFTVITCALPLNLLSFNGKVYEENIVLNWKTENEKDFSHFEIQKSDNALEFASIGKVRSNLSNYYNFIDINPNIANNYYRLKMVNIDGTVDFSKTINVNYKYNKEFISIENPAKLGELNIATNSINPVFNLISVTGSKIETSVIRNGEGKYILKPIQNISGIYYLNINSNGKIVNKKVLFLD